jgi:Domain of unknown function (DUF4333)
MPKFARPLPVAALAATAALAGCESGTKTVTVHAPPIRPVLLDTARVQRAITESILTRRSLHSRVVCPLRVRQITGGHFDCTATVNGRAYIVAVTQVDGAGHVTYIVK